MDRGLSDSKSKVVFLDWCIFSHRAIYAWINNRNVPAMYTAMSMIMASLKRVGVTPEDIIIVAVDSPLGSWRRDVDPQYKANRKEQREKQTEIDWTKQFGDSDSLLENLEASTPFHVIRIDRLEADDIIAYGVRHYKDRECVIVSSDTDFEQLAKFSNVKLFSPQSKKYKFVKNPYKSLARKTVKEATDNLVNPITTDAEYETRNQIVNLTVLPKDVEASIEAVLSHLNVQKDFTLETLKFRNIRENFMTIYNSDKIVTEAESFKKKKKKPKIKTLDKFF